MKIQLKKSRSLFLFRQRWRFVITASNGEIIATSELYSNRIDAIWTMNILKLQLRDAELLGIDGEIQ